MKYIKFMELKKEPVSNVAILEKVEETPSSLNSVLEEKKVETDEKKESAKKTLFTNTPTQYMENLKKNFDKTETKQEQKNKQVTPKIQFKAAETFFSESKEPKKKQTPGQVSFSNYYNKDFEEEIKPQTSTQEETEIKYEESNLISLSVEKYNEEEIKENSEENIETDSENKNKRKAKFKTRLKIICFGTVAVLVCMMGWAIYNAVEIKTLTEEMEQANKIYSVNVVTHISNISKADDLTNPDSIFNLSALSDAEVIPLTPSPQEPIEYSVKSNWFDRFCNWLSNLFN